MTDTTYDFIVVGAGSAGCALAYRLAASSHFRILLLEAGSPARNPMLHMPLGFAFLLKEHDNNWNYQTQPEPQLKQRQIDLPRGKVLGGCSAINGMVYVRGQKEDYDRWAELGNVGWSYDEVLPYFKRSEDNENGANAFHGSGGPLRVSNVRNEFPICNDYIKACEQAGHPSNNDINGSSQQGAGFFPNNIKNGKRLSSASAFLKPGQQLNNLTVVPYTQTSRVLFEGQKAVGVECMVKGQKAIYQANKEVVLCGGAINSPKILELSGIGQAERLQQQFIPLVKDLPGVGENLHDHWNSYIKRSVDRGSTYFAESKPLAMFGNLFRYLFKKEGFMSNPAALVAVFYNALNNSERPDSQIHFAPAASEADAKGNLVPIDGITAAACALRPSSRGHTHIESSNPDQPPAIHVNFLDTEQDRQMAVETFKRAREIFQQDAMQPYGGQELEPGSAVQTDEQILNYICETGEPVHHLAGTCKMGHDEMAVVDDQLRVHGVQGLRVADAAIMPELVSGNTHACCVMIGEKAADMLLAAAK